MSDQDLAAQVEELRARQEQTDQSLVALAALVETLVDHAQGHPLSETALSGAFAGALQVTEAVKQRHQSNRER